MGMAKSFYRPRPENLIENFDAPPYFHEKSKQYFEMRKRGEDIVFRRWQRDSNGARINVFEQVVDWILGSGHHARTYVYRTPGGELYQLPVNWYTATREWRMAPGYDRADHDGVTRRVRHECMFCHNAYAAVPKEPYSYWRPQTFPAELPEGMLRALEPFMPGRVERELRIDESPYAGLNAFQESDANRFFGRTNEVAAVVNRLRDQPLLAVVGPSGIGKSSFVRAGVVPALKRLGERWEAFVLRPGRSPLFLISLAPLRVATGACNRAKRSNSGGFVPVSPRVPGRPRGSARCRPSTVVCR